MVRLLNATPRPGYRHHLEYDDGIKGEVDLSHLAGRGVFAAWHDPALFDTVTVGSHGELHWTDDLEICGDALYLQLTGNRADEVLPNLRASAE